MKFQDYYEVLGVARDASTDAIKKAYRKLALEWHPDRHEGGARERAEQTFKRVSEAYEVLFDPGKRAKYDRFGEHWKHGQEFTPPPGSGGRRMTPEEFASMFGGGGRGGFSDFFTSMFGEDLRDAFGREQPRTARGPDVRAELSLPLADALRGGKSLFEIPTHVPCGRCGGAGRVGQHVCPTCIGVGSLTERRKVDLSIPADVRDGTTLRLAGLGGPGQGGGPAGDLFLTLRLADDALYKRLGDDVEAELPIAPWEALSGGKLDVRTLDGVVTLSIPANTRAGTRMRLRGKGLPDGKGGRGDLYVVLRLALPAQLTERQQELLTELGRLDGDSDSGSDPEPHNGPVDGPNADPMPGPIAGPIAGKVTGGVREP